MKKQTAGRDSLGEFAPKFAELNDDILFGQIWSREGQLSLRDSSIITVTVLLTKGIFDNSLKYHLTNAKKQWRDGGRNGGNHYPCWLLRRLAQCLGYFCAS